jgi:hypothetical protein
VLVRVQVRGDLDGLVGAPLVQLPRIVLSEHGHGRDPELAAGPEDPNRDLSAVRYEKLSKSAGYFEGPFDSPRVSGTKIPGGGDGGRGGGCLGFLAIANSV